ncbi:NADH-quinone oxidoreductase subunit B family protein [Arenibaculum pallidiluteum]|uniref:NADH-quinone oxidoreductase subunit B family protein n=1 Tax=Arenibaculum pallidiluteum TaxID=2812559 RepID=UPI001A97427D
MLVRILGNLLRRPPVIPGPGPAPGAEAELAARLDRLSHVRLGRSLAIRQIDAGSCNGCELEISALGNRKYDLERFGLRFVTSPRHADVLLVTGPVTHNMREALYRTWQATPDPKWVVACGACALDGGVFRGSYGVAGGIDQVVPVHLRISGCPPSPAEILAGLVALIEHSARPGSAVGVGPREESVADVAQETVEPPRVAGGVGIHEAHGAGQVLAAPAERGPDRDLGS